MADKSGIEWTEATWNPTTGCDRVSPGCDNCYALTLAARLKAMGSAAYQRDGDPRTSGPGFALTTHADRLDQPVLWTKPRRIFVNSMSDLFHDQVPDEFIASVFEVIARTPRHTYQLLTKRHGRLRSLLSRPSFRDNLAHWGAGWPLPNLWVGVSVEDQKRADLRIPALLDTPAAVRWLSMEPLLNRVDVLGHLTSAPGINWVVVGGESGLASRPMQVEWARSLRAQCVTTGVPFFFKQWGGRTPKANGRELDGRTWDEYPAVAHA